MVLNAGSPSPAKVVLFDIKAGASIVHVIDSIIVPDLFYALLSPLGPTIATTLSQIADVSALWNAINS